MSRCTVKPGPRQLAAEYAGLRKNWMSDGKTGFWTPYPVRSDHVFSISEKKGILI
jgi:hypothetical protein